jgi:hypothetical protein
MEKIIFNGKPVKATFTGELYHDGGLKYENDKFIYSVFDGVAEVRQSKNTWGGSRGGGRPEKLEKKTKTISFRPSPEVEAILAKVNNKTAFIEMAILAFQEKENPGT